MKNRFVPVLLSSVLAVSPIVANGALVASAESDYTERFVTALEDEVEYLNSVYFQSNFDLFSPSERRLYALLQAFLGVVKNDAINELPSEFYYGMYYLTGSSDAHSVTVITGNSVLAVADDFECYMVWHDYYGNDVEPPEYTVTPFTTSAPYINSYGNLYTFTTGSAFVDRKYCILRSNYFTATKAVGYDVTNAALAVYSNNLGIPTINSSTDFTQSSGAIMGKPTVASFPAGSFSPASPWEYYNNVLVPSINAELPENVQISPIDEPYEPIYPTDFVTGVPKDWTVTNPQLPEIPEIGIYKPSGDLPTISLAPYAHGVGFWWALVGEILDTTALKTLCVTFLGVGLLIYCLWRLGR